MYVTWTCPSGIINLWFASYLQRELQYNIKLYRFSLRLSVFNKWLVLLIKNMYIQWLVCNQHDLTSMLSYQTVGMPLHGLSLSDVSHRGVPLYAVSTYWFTTLWLVTPWRVTIWRANKLICHSMARHYWFVTSWRVTWWRASLLTCHSMVNHCLTRHSGGVPLNDVPVSTDVQLVWHVCDLPTTFVTSTF